jgi:gliding motility-associated-like protein
VIKGNTPTGGGGSDYDYRWRMFKNGTEIADVKSKDLIFVFPKSDDIETYKYLREVTSRRYNCVSISDTYEVIVQPEIINTLVQRDQKLCEGNTAESLTSSEIKGGSGLIDVYQWEVSIDQTDWKAVAGNNLLSYMPQLELPANFGLNNYKPRFYRRYVESGACTSESVPVQVHFEKKPEILTEDRIGKNALIFSDSSSLRAHPDNSSGRWSSRDRVFFTPGGEPNTATANNLQEGVFHTIVWEVENSACYPKDSILIEVKSSKMYGISPNNDGLNECFKVAGVEQANGYDLMILDRYNKVVYQKDEKRLPDCLWNGRDNNGKELPSGVYFYQLVLDGDKRKTYKGYVVLKK